MTVSRSAVVLGWVAQIVAAAILGMAGFAKVTGGADPIALFTLLGAEPVGRLVVGVAEIVATLLLLVPHTAQYGGLLGAVILLGAIGTHLFRIGINYGGDASLFVMACVGLVASVAAAMLRRR